jgi:hypothetical protein
MLTIKPEPDSAQEARSNQPLERKSYKKPRLQLYGDLAEITKGQNSGGKNDGSGHPNRHSTS